MDSEDSASKRRNAETAEFAEPRINRGLFHALGSSVSLSTGALCSFLRRQNIGKARHFFNRQRLRPTLRIDARRVKQLHFRKLEEARSAEAMTKPDAAL